LPDEDFGRPGKDLQRPNQVEDLGAWRSNKNDPARCARRTWIQSTIHSSLIKRHKLLLSVFTNLSGAASNVFLSSSEQK
jgi:hypothetical protein